MGGDLSGVLGLGRGPGERAGGVGVIGPWRALAGRGVRTLVVTAGGVVGQRAARGQR